MQIKLIAIDVDGTLLNSYGALLASTQQAVATCLARGIKVVICSGRPLVGVADYLKALGITGHQQYVITVNGALTLTASGQCLIQHSLTSVGYQALTAFSRQVGVPFNVLDTQGTIYTADRDVDEMIVAQAAENHAGLLIREP